MLAGCTSGPAPQPRYLMGEPYRDGGIWSYPREDFALDESGIAAILPRNSGLTANGELRDAGSMMAAHRTLQLPAIVTVTNLESGRSVRVRVNDRGPAMAGRVIAVSPRVAALLGTNAPFQARVAIDAAASRAAIEGLPGQPSLLPIDTAPRGVVERESLAPPPGARGVAAQPAPAATTIQAEAAPAARVPERLPEEVRQGPASPGQIWLEAERFFRRDLAMVQAARIGGRAETFGPPGRQQQWRVRAGPYGTIAAADAALARALAAGQPDLRLAVD